MFTNRIFLPNVVCYLMENLLTGNTSQEANYISISGLDHVAIVVPDLVKAIEFY